MTVLKFGTPALLRIAFLVGNILAGSVIFSGVVKPIYSFFSDREDDIAGRRRLLSHLTALVERGADFRSFETGIRRMLEHGEFLVGGSESVISADLQTRLNTIVISAGARSRAVQSLPYKGKGLMKFGGSRIEIYGPLQSIYRAVYAIESAKPYLFITSAVIKASPAVNRRVASAEPIIQVQLDIVGALRPREGRQ